MEKMRILVVDDEVHILELIKYNLEQSGFLVDVVENGEAAMHKLLEEEYNLLMLDLMLPGISGTEVCQRVRRNAKLRRLPIIMLTAKGEENDKIEGLDTGADDYITKPFSVNELKARINSLLRRSGDMVESGAVEINGITIDSVKHEVSVDGASVEMTLKEYELLRMLILNKGKVLTRDVILDRVWGYEYFGDTRTVDVHIRHIRRKIGQDKGKLIETVRGVGYKMK